MGCVYFGFDTSKKKNLSYRLVSPNRRAYLKEVHVIKTRGMNYKALNKQVIISRSTALGTKRWPYTSWSSQKAAPKPAWGRELQPTPEREVGPVHDRMWRPQNLPVIISFKLGLAPEILLGTLISPLINYIHSMCCSLHIYPSETIQLKLRKKHPAVGPLRGCIYVGGLKSQIVLSNTE